MSRPDPAQALRAGILSAVTSRFEWMDPTQAEILADAAVDHLQAEYGGDRLYIPARSKAERDAAIRREFNGRNLDALCLRYGLSPARVYQIVGNKTGE